jgi:hypothetical protein
MVFRKIIPVYLNNDMKLLDCVGVTLAVKWLVCWPLDPNVAGSKPGQGDGFLRAIKIRSTPSSRMGSKAGRSHVIRFYGM